LTLVSVAGTDRKYRSKYEGNVGKTRMLTEDQHAGFDWDKIK